MDTRSKAQSTGTTIQAGRTIPSLRWWIGSLIGTKRGRALVSLYHLPQDHPRITLTERQMILADHQEDKSPARTPPRWRDLRKLPQTWGTIIAKSFTDPVFFFIADWFPIYLVSKGIAPKSGSIAVWIPCIAADLGNFSSGWLSGLLIKPGWSVGNARKVLAVFGGFGVGLLIPTILTVNLCMLTLLFALAAFSYASFTTIANVLPSDLYKNESVATVGGFSGTGGRPRRDYRFQIGGPSFRCAYCNGEALYSTRSWLSRA